MHRSHLKNDAPRVPITELDAPIGVIGVEFGQ